MKPIVIIGIAVGLSVVAVFSVLFRVGFFTAYQISSQLDQIQSFEDKIENYYFNAIYPRLESCISGFNSVSDKRECKMELTNSIVRYVEREADSFGIDNDSFYVNGYKNLISGHYDSLCYEYGRNC